MKTVVLCFALCFAAFLLPSYAHSGETVTGKVVMVKDGDTVVIAPADGRENFTCRLYGIDTPETAKRGKPGQPYGEEATAVMKRLGLGKDAVIRLTGAKTYGREVCLIEVDGMDINLEMVRQGMAWAYRQYLKRPYASEYIGAEREAQSLRHGLWQDANPEPPWEFRKRLKDKRRVR